tara:strand:+ start:245 stop:478 length:234 start_codon:yes stop_codon:yes gene_type:complete
MVVISLTSVLEVVRMDMQTHLGQKLATLLMIVAYHQVIMVVTMDLLRSLLHGLLQNLFMIEDTAIALTNRSMRVVQH